MASRKRKSNSEPPKEIIKERCVSCGTYLSLKSDNFVAFVNNNIKCIHCYDANAKVQYEPHSKAVKA